MHGRWWLLGGVLASVASFVVARGAYLGPGPLQVRTEVVVPRGGGRVVGRALAEAGVVRSALVFQIARAATAFDGPIRAAEFAFSAHASLAAVLQTLRFGNPVLHRLTLAEGLTSAQVAGVLADAHWLSGEIRLPPEGSVLPQTYAFERGTSRDAAIARAEAAQRAWLEAAWPGRAPGLPLRTPADAVVLASLVERETAIAAERPMVAGVFYNRLRLGMKLQSDPTAAYGASGGLGGLGRSLEREDLARADPVNTYAVPRLPLAPICNPGSASLSAVLHPAPTAALYFVADGHGGHVFAETLEAHLRNVEGRRARK